MSGRSSFSAPMGKRSRWASEAMPVPKSSRSMATPSAARRVSVPITSAWSNAFSVISRCSRRAGRPVSRSTVSTSSTSDRRATWRGERLTETVRSAPGAAASHSCICRQASRSAHRPSVRICPVASATGRNSAGSSTRPSGVGQRSRASKPRSARGSSAKTGWNARRNSPWRSPRCSASSICTRAAMRSRRRVVEELVALAAQALRRVHGGVRVAQQLLRARVAAAAERDAHAGGDRHVAAERRHRRLHLALDAVGHQRRVVDVGDAVEQDRELVAREARDRVARTQAARPAAWRPRSARRRPSGGRACR